MNAVVTRDGDITRLAKMENAMLHKLNPAGVKLEIGREFNGFSMFEFAKECLEAHGKQTRTLSKLELVQLAFQTTSEFPSLLGNVANKTLRRAYDESRVSYRVWARRAPDRRTSKQSPAFKSATRPTCSALASMASFNTGT